MWIQEAVLPCIFWEAYTAHEFFPKFIFGCVEEMAHNGLWKSILNILPCIVFQNIIFVFDSKNGVYIYILETSKYYIPMPPLLKG